MGAKVVDFPISDRLRPEQVVGEIGKLDWESLVGVGITTEGDFEVINRATSHRRDSMRDCRSINPGQRNGCF